jgi:xanthine dehydrogenase accessory factor
MKNIYLQIIDLQLENSPLVLATVTRVAGSTPQKPGSSALFGLEGLLSGTIGGGVVEGEVEQIAKKAIQSKESGHYTFNLDHDISLETEAICGGQISILVDATPEDHHAVLEQVKQSLKNRVPGVLVSWVTGIRNNMVHIHRYWVTENWKHTVPGEHFQLIESEVRSLLLNGKAGDYREVEINFPGEKNKILFFLEPVFPPAHLVIAGAGHIGKALAHQGRLLDFEVTVIDDRAEYANPGNIPDADHIILEDIGLAMQDLKKTSDTYVVIVTRGHKDDASALKPCIGSDAAYVGMIGSKKKIALMCRKFVQNGWANQGQWKKIYAPVGLEIQSKTIQEIAVSIAGQLVLVRNSKNQAHD